ncbi:MAG TPA: DUF6152 family protein [Gammaproteobacteria bacterium]
MTSIKITTALLAATAVLVAARPLAAHHSAAMFDDTKVVELSGTVKALQWTNPHVWLQVVVATQGRATEWSFEGGSPNSLSRQGWRSTTFKAGDVVTVRLRPMKDGTAAGQFIGAKFAADGHTVGRWE